MTESAMMDAGGELLELGKNLMLAARNNDVKTVVELMRYGAPFATDWWGRTALHHAAEEGHLEMVQLLIKSGILKDTRSKVDKTPLHLACQGGHAEVAKCLVLNGADVNARDMISMTPLHWAVEAGDVETVEVLLQNGAEPLIANKFDKTCIDIAMDSKNMKVMALLQAGCKTGPHTVRQTAKFQTDLGKTKFYINTVSTVKGKRAPATGNREVLVEKGADDEMWQYLEEHGIEMLEGEDVSLVAAALGSGQSVYVTEAGRQALSLTDGAKQKVLAARSTASPMKVLRTSIKSDLQGSPPKRSHSPDESVMTELTSVSNKYFQSKREAEQYRLLYMKKKKEAAVYHDKLKTLLKLIKDGDNVNFDLVDEDEGLEEEEEDELGEEEEFVQDEGEIDES